MDTREKSEEAKEEAAIMEKTHRKNKMDLSLGLEGTHVLVTGAAGYIGSATVLAFLSAGANVTALDIRPDALAELHDKFPKDSNAHLATIRCDITDESALEYAFVSAKELHGPVACCIALASLDLSVLEHHDSLMDMPLEQWQRTFKVNVEGTFLTARTWLRGLKMCKLEGRGEGLRNVGLVIVGSESGTFGERGNADYAAGKSAVQGGLLQSLRADVGRVWEGARVNAIAPGPVNTAQFVKECEANPEQLWLDAQATTAMRQPVSTEVVAKSILYLASEVWSGHVLGQVLSVDSGKMGKVMWTKEECAAMEKQS
ncbi:MAG: hypothetical protein MMC33_008632 [Icmadophila ericetorum]|nr:hypothetical protein [Icmadophila ericetorum]